MDDFEWNGAVWRVFKTDDRLTLERDDAPAEALGDGDICVDLLCAWVSALVESMP